MQPIKELLSAAGLCAGRGCALTRQLANCLRCLLQGMSYLERCGIVHRDLAARNVLGLFITLSLYRSFFAMFIFVITCDRRLQRSL